MMCAVAALAMPLAGCSVYAEPVRGPVVEAYEPDRYDGSIVYFENEQPYVIVDDEIRYVPTDRAEYATFRTHYHVHSAAYIAWYGRHTPPRGRRAPPAHESRRGHHDRD